MLVAASFCLLLILRILVDATRVTLPATHDLNRQAGVFESDISDTAGHGVSGCALPGARCPHRAPEFPDTRCFVRGDRKGGQVGYPWKGLSKCSSEMHISGR